MTKRIRPSAWVWHGHPLHFICASRCNFRLGTEIGSFVVSTVGDYYPNGDTGPRENVGAGRAFETMVFRIVGRMPCGCPEITGECIEMTPYDSAADARDGHMRACRAVADGAFT